MQSGISASSDLHDAFASFLSTPSLFSLPITIENEQLVPLQPIPFSSITDGAANLECFYSSLPSLKDVIQPKTPLYILLRRFPPEDSAESQLIALTYIPSNSPVRAKTLFASTRATVVRELGSEKFCDTVFAADEEEVLSESVWREREADKNAARGGSGNGTGEGADDAERRRQAVMGEQERELDALRQAENEARSMSRRRDIGIGGTVGTDGPADIKGIAFPVGEGVKEALQGLQNNEGEAVLLGIDIPTETLTLVSIESNVTPGSLAGCIPSSKPQYTFYRHPNSSAVLFIYTCPSSSAIKERMLYASCRAGTLVVAAAQGLNVSHKIEASDADDITQQRLEEEICPPKDEGPKRGFARPRRPGRSIASAVALPDPEPPSPDTPLKRRQAPLEEENHSKRRRVSTTEDSNKSPTAPESNIQGEETLTRRKGGADDERKRGKRLFGALLGTLSQTSSTAAQKRRADIERKQQAKLKKQDEEYNEESRRKRQELMARRKEEQRVYERESIQTRHANMRAMAHFLQTKTKPTLYYKPWQLRPEDEDVIKTQIEETQAVIEREIEALDRRDGPVPGSQHKEHKESPDEVQPAAESTDTGSTMKPSANKVPNPDMVGTDTDHDEAPDTQKQPTTNDENTIPDHSTETAHTRQHEDDSGEVVLEDKEDTEAPEFSEESAPRYAFKQCAQDMKELARQLGTSQIILGGHDWGGFVVYRIALHCPGFVTHIFSVCTPYGPPHREYVPLDKLVATRIPFFGYQLQFVSGELEKKIKTKNDIRQFLIALFGGRTPEGEIGFDVTKGALLDKVPNLRPSRLLSEEELDYYVEEYSRTGIHGPLNWYRTREQNYKEDLELIGQKWEVPVLFIRATKDDALRPELSKNMGKYIPNLTQAEVDATHWALWQKPEECNAIISNWIENVAFGGRSKM
ncbi:hypothetical protein LOZ39_002433 [Ophidiomyces ophidiicola]|nr:hypothetical protein LOZ64_002855 [Ophidiomyces ophidiicola]KAI2014849.1 hypothetical protein LOZ49_001076 [Ophidiomyces ophidiicola]KAI2046557.1 hypothetical protein LOZ44_004456 [Ophidiomyces ophidiicola]KAI2076980.1 hypothetical protein LOZ39_002433 [Ophidiomyces ophidiicola]KAI2131817.1 hypothetical protein LOZ29_005287 [Ophidiomyces ophidiicola]